MKKKLIQTFVMALLLMMPALLFGQQKNSLLIRGTGTFVPEENTKAFIESNKKSEATVAGKYYKILQFQQVPSIEEKARLHSAGVQFLEYIPKNAYLVAIDQNFSRTLLTEVGARSVIELTGEMKLDYRLLDWDIPQHAKVGKKVRVSLISMQGLRVETFQKDLSQLGLSVKEYGQDQRFAYLNLA
ncbi:MAG: hypothetical protein AAF985_15670, partial [Bacteroidota bacterium]